MATVAVRQRFERSSSGTKKSVSSAPRRVGAGSTRLALVSDPATAGIETAAGDVRTPLAARVGLLVHVMHGGTALKAGTTLSGPASPRRSTGSAEIVVGIPSLNEASTIGHVVTAAVQGLRRLGVIDRAVLVNADNGSRDGTPDVFAATAGSTPHEVVITPAENSGKGTNVLAIMQAACRLDARQVILLDADVRSIEPEWIGRLLEAVDTDEPTLATAVYRRNRFEGNTTNHLISPLIGATLGARVEQPVAGDFAFNRALLNAAMTWPVPESAHLYGIDAHLSANAVLHGARVVQVPLGRKIHNPGFPKILHGSQQMVDAVLHVIARCRRPVAVRLAGSGHRTATDDQAVRPDAALIRRTVDKAMRYLAFERTDITRLYPSLGSAPQAPWGYRIDHRVWSELIADLLTALAGGEAQRARDHLVALYLSRVMSYWEEIEGRSPAQVDALLDTQAQAVADAVSTRKLTFSGATVPMRFRAGVWAKDVP